MSLFLQVDGRSSGDSNQLDGFESQQESIMTNGIKQQTTKGTETETETGTATATAAASASGAFGLVVLAWSLHGGWEDPSCHLICLSGANISSL